MLNTLLGGSMDKVLINAPAFEYYAFLHPQAWLLTPLMRWKINSWNEKALYIKPREWEIQRICPCGLSLLDHNSFLNFWRAWTQLDWGTGVWDKTVTWFWVCDTSILSTALLTARQQAAQLETTWELHSECNSRWVTLWPEKTRSRDLDGDRHKWKHSWWGGRGGELVTECVGKVRRKSPSFLWRIGVLKISCPLPLSDCKTTQGEGCPNPRVLTYESNSTFHIFLGTALGSQGYYGQSHEGMSLWRIVLSSSGPISFRGSLWYDQMLQQLWVSVLFPSTLLIMKSVSTEIFWNVTLSSNSR